MTSITQKNYLTSSPNDTFALGAELGKGLNSGGLFCFFGDLAAGKTTFIKGFVSGAIGIEPDLINSPTFTYMNIYRGAAKTCYHFDLYRIPGSEEFMMMGFDEYLEKSNSICCIEWSEHIIDIIPPTAKKIEISHEEEGSRRISIV